jgi:hypothetical protein
MTFLALIAALSMLAAAHAGCPQYTSIAQKTAFEFDPRVYEGIWCVESSLNTCKILFSPLL